MPFLVYPPTVPIIIQLLLKVIVMQKHLAFFVFSTILSVSVLNGQAVASFINEVNYLASNPSHRGVEIAGQAGSSLNGWSAVTYNLNGTVNTVNDLGNQVIPSQQNGYGTIWYDVEQSGNGGGLALVNPNGGVEQFVSYGAAGVITAVAGPANGLSSQFIGIQLLPNKSLQLTGTGLGYLDFVWALPGHSTRGGVNLNQVLGLLPPVLVYGGNGATGQTAGNQSVASVFELTIFPNPVVAQVQIRLANTTEATTNAQLFDLKGKLVGRAIFGENQASTSLDMSQLPAGSYVVSVGNTSKMVVKQ
jgi:Secretion system C-terminal sorting domain